MAGIGDDVAHRLPRAQNRAEVEHMPAFFGGRFRLPRSDHRHENDNAHGRSGRREQKGAAPSEPFQRAARECVGHRSANTEGGRVEGHRARLSCLRQAVGEHLEARHVGAGEPCAGEHAPRQRGPESRREECQPDERRRREHRTQNDDIAGVDPVGRRGEKGDREDVAAEERPREPAGHGVAHVPRRLKQRQQRPVGRETGHREHLGQAHHGDQCRRTPQYGLRDHAARPVVTWRPWPR